jgi:hypothetical protein
MAGLSVPGADEVNLVAQVGNSVLQGLRQPSQPAPWPNTRDALLELLAILDEWNRRATLTTRYALHLAERRQGRIADFAADLGMSNLLVDYWRSVRVDTERVLKGRIPPMAKLRGSSRRQAARRGLRTVLVAYCPDLLEQFEAATSARLDWVQEHCKNFDRWFDESHTDEEVTRLLTEMTDTKARLYDVEVQLRGFITTNFPLKNTAPSP